LDLVFLRHVHDNMVLIDKTVIIGEHWNREDGTGGVSTYVIVVGYAEEAFPLSFEMNLLEHQPWA
jgi:hypothetical protein